MRNPDKKCDEFARRRARKLSLPARPYTRKEVYERGGGACWHCLSPTPFGVGHVDHLIPLASQDCPGDTPENVVWSCATCNLRKGQSTSSRFWHDHLALRAWYRTNCAA